MMVYHSVAQWMVIHPPRHIQCNGIDPYSGRSIPIDAVTDTTITLNVGVSAPNKYFTPTNRNNLPVEI